MKVCPYRPLDEVSMTLLSEITVARGDDPDAIAGDFVKKHKLKDSHVKVISDHIRNQIATIVKWDLTSPATSRGQILPH